MSGTARTTQGTPRTTHNGEALLLFIIGGILLVFFALEVTTFQIQTSESFLRGDQQKSETITSDWNVWFQLPKLAWSGAPGPAIKSDDVPSIIIAQGVEYVYITIVSAAGVVATRNRKMPPLLAFISLLGLILICIFDGYSDYKYGNVPDWEHVFFALFCTFVIGFFPKWGLALIKEGFKHL